jgi:hypothetical protein
VFITQAGLKLSFLLLQPPKCCYYMCAPPHPAASAFQEYLPCICPRHTHTPFENLVPYAEISCPCCLKLKDDDFFEETDTLPQVILFFKLFYQPPTTLCTTIKAFSIQEMPMKTQFFMSALCLLSIKSPCLCFR